MSPQREAQQPSPSSAWLTLAEAHTRRLGPRMLVPLVLVHVLAQAASAGSERLTSRWHETRAWAALAGAAWLLALGYLALVAARPGAPRRGEPRAHALDVAERAAAWVVLAFALVHGASFAARVLGGELAASDVRPELLASLSSTTHGVPLLAAGYLCGVGSAAFVVARVAARELTALELGARGSQRAAVLVGLCACALGVYAVLRFATGSLAPW